MLCQRLMKMTLWDRRHLASKSLITKGLRTRWPQSQQAGSNVHWYSSCLGRLPQAGRTSKFSHDCQAKILAVVGVRCREVSAFDIRGKFLNPAGGGVVQFSSYNCNMVSRTQLLLNGDGDHTCSLCAYGKYSLTVSAPSASIINHLVSSFRPNSVLRRSRVVCARIRRQAAPTLLIGISTERISSRVSRC